MKINRFREWVARVGNVFILLCLLVSNSNPVQIVQAAAGNTIRISVSSSGIQGDNGSLYPYISADGRYVAFASSATNLVPGDTNGRGDIFVRDMQSNTITRVSVDSSGVQGNSSSYDLSISGDGRFIAFYSIASNLVIGDTNGASDVFVHDRQTGITTRVSVDSNGMQANDQSNEPAISSDGRYVAFTSLASNLVSGDTNGEWDIFMRDLQTNTTPRISFGEFGSNYPAISSDGRFITFSAQNNSVWIDVFVRDMQTGITTRVSVDIDGAPGNGYSSRPAISADGRYVAFSSDVSNLVSGDTNECYDIFVRDRQSGITTRVSVDSSGVQGNGNSSGPDISADGRYVVFESFSSNLVFGDTNGSKDIFMHDIQTGTTTRVSIDPNGAQGNQSSWFPAISADGHFVVYDSESSNLVSGDTNEVSDVFRHETAVLTTAPFTTCANVAGIPQVECEALVALYNSANGENWINKTGWLQTDTPCSWYGVTCASGTNVKELRLEDNQLSGYIPVEIGNLTSLDHLILYGNQLSGNIPNEIGNLTSLGILNLSKNQLSGSIPAEIGNTDVSYLYLYLNQLSGSIPVELGNLTHLQDLYLDDNLLTGSIPEELGNSTCQ